MKNLEKMRKKGLIFFTFYVMILRYADIVRRDTCDDAGGGRPRVGKFPRSMSDFKPGEKDGVHKRSCGFSVQRRSDPLSGIVCNPSNAGFIMRSKEKHGAL